MSGISNTELSPPEGGELASFDAPLTGVVTPGPNRAARERIASGKTITPREYYLHMPSVRAVAENEVGPA